MPGCTSRLLRRRRTRRSPHGWGVVPSERFPSSGRPACCGLVSLCAHLTVAEAVEPSEGFAQMRRRCGIALCTSLRGPHKDDAIPETQPPHESRYNDSLTRSNACATMALIGRAFLLSQLPIDGLVELISCAQAIHRSSTAAAFFTGRSRAGWAPESTWRGACVLALRGIRATLKLGVDERPKRRFRAPAMSVQRSSAGNRPNRRRSAARPGRDCRRDAACAPRRSRRRRDRPAS